jgi:hypothetical protein
VMADAFRSMVSSAATALSCAAGEPADFAHKETSSIAEAKACWLCKSKVRTSAIAIVAWLLSGMDVILEGWCKDRSKAYGDAV